MQQAFQGRYKNEESAYQAYNQTVTGRRTGRRLGEIADEAQPRVQSEKLREQFRTGQKKRRPRPSGLIKYSPDERSSLGGLWKVNVTFTFVDEDGKEYEETRTFIAESSQYTSLLDIPYIEQIVLASVDEHIDYWTENDSLGGNYTNKQVEVVPIYRSDVNPERRIDLDEIDELVIE